MRSWEKGIGAENGRNGPKTAGKSLIMIERKKMFFAQRSSYVSQFQLLVAALQKTIVGESCSLTISDRDQNYKNGRVGEVETRIEGELARYF